MSSEENKTAQNDEIEALSSIYGDEWCAVDEQCNIYCITVNDGTEKPIWTICIQVHLPENYPSESPPEYQLNAPWLRGDERRNIEDSLADVYCENIGESIIYLWVEKIREHLQSKANSEPVNTDHGSKRQVTMTTEVTGHDDDFDPSILLELQNYTTDHDQEPSDGIECPSISHGECVSDRRSTFQPHLAPVHHKSQIKMVMDKLYENKKIENATHNIIAYRICCTNNIMLQGCEDDGETHAGSRMLHLLQILEAENVLVIVSRWYGGIHLGPDRFKHINNCTRTILQKCGYIKDKADKKGPRTNSEKKKR
ncbi:hypothetical protein ACF0H5_006589 [Mactra antiquata]